MEFNAGGGVEAFMSDFSLFFLSFSRKKKKGNKNRKENLFWLIKLHHATINKGVVQRGDGRKKKEERTMEREFSVQDGSSVKL